MDAFRLLTRSLNLPRKSTKTAEAQNAPSQGAASDPRLYGSTKNADRLSGGTNKRKRQEEETAKSKELPKELDFFADQASGVTNTKAIDGKGKAEATTNGAAREETIDVVEATQAGDEALDEEGRRRILKEHKVKITELWAPSLVEVPDSAVKKRKRTKGAPPADSSKKKKRRLDIVPQPLTSFSQLRSRYQMSDKLLGNLAVQGYTIPTEVQLGSLPLLCDAQYRPSKQSKDAEVTNQSDSFGPSIDLLTVAPTGSGKTLAFLVPVLNAILQRRRLCAHIEGKAYAYEGTQALIIAPTKELASQIVNEGRKLTLNTGVKVTLVRKGMTIARSAGENKDPLNDEEVTLSQDDEEDEIGENEAPKKAGKSPATKAEVLVSTPLTLVHAAEGSQGSLSSVLYLVLDEADVLLDPLFREQTLKIWGRCSNPQLRVSLWSATMGASIEALAMSTIEQRCNETEQGKPLISRSRLVRLVVGLKDSAIPNVQHRLLYAGNEQGKLMALRQLLRPSMASSDVPSIRPPFLVFTQTIPRAVALHSELLYDIPQEAGGSSRIAVLHSDLSDTARERVMTQVRKGEIWVLITTDLLSRGVDFKGINGVVNYDFPNSSAVYVHRVGRTGRGGREGGVAVTLYAKEDIPFVKNVANVIAASERQGNITNVETEARQRLLDNLPKPSKRDKQQLKKRGIESRRTDKEGASAANRISTKSGYQRKLENNRKSAAKGRSHQALQNVSQEGAENDGEFSGFDD